MSTLGNTDPVNGQPMGITALKWLQALRSHYGQTDEDTTPSTNDSYGITLLKILRVLNRV